MSDMTTSEYYVQKKGVRRYLRKLHAMTRRICTLEDLMYKVHVAYNRLKEARYEQDVSAEMWLDVCPDDPLREEKRELWLTVLAAAETIRKVTYRHGLFGNLAGVWSNLTHYWDRMQEAYETVKNDTDANGTNRKGRTSR